MTEFTAEQFIAKLNKLRPAHKRDQDDPVLDAGAADVYIGGRMGQVFALAKECMNMPPTEIEARQTQAGYVSRAQIPGRALIERHR